MYYLDSGLILRVLDLELGSAKPLTEMILIGAAEELVNKGKMTEMVAGWEILKSLSPRTSHDLYYWENTSEGATSEVHYLISRDMIVIPVEVKAGVTGNIRIRMGFSYSFHSFQRFFQTPELRMGRYEAPSFSCIYKYN